MQWGMLFVAKVELVRIFTYGGQIFYNPQYQALRAAAIRFLLHPLSIIIISQLGLDTYCQLHRISDTFLSLNQRYLSNCELDLMMVCVEGFYDWWPLPSYESFNIIILPAELAILFFNTTTFVVYCVSSCGRPVSRQREGLVGWACGR